MSQAGFCCFHYCFLGKRGSWSIRTSSSFVVIIPVYGARFCSGQIGLVERNGYFMWFCSEKTFQAVQNIDAYRAYQAGRTIDSASRRNSGEAYDRRKISTFLAGVIPDTFVVKF